MAVYALGDIQGCHRELMNLLAAVAFDPARDRLWLTGDLVNRGPDSLAVMREIMRLGAAVTCVLGNHDLHLLALAFVPGEQPRRRDTLADVLAAPDREAILEWLRTRPLLHVDADLGYAMVHAGLPPEWTVPEAQARAAEVEAVLRDRGALGEFLPHMYGDTPQRWTPDLRGHARLRFITNCLTRMRYCTADGALDLDEKGSPPPATADRVPWYAVAGRRSAGTPIVFGHWSSLRLEAAACRRWRVYPLDTGAVWGDRLSALRLEDRTLFSVSSTLVQTPE